MSEYTIVFIHGTGGAEADWLPNISKELAKLGILNVIPKLPNKTPLKVNDWLDGLHKVVKDIPSSIVFVGYSLGTRTALLYLDKYERRTKAIFLVAAFSNNLSNALMTNGKYASFFSYEIDMNKLKDLVEMRYIVHSVDDDSIPYSQAVELSGDLDAKLITFQGKKHFCNPEYYLDILAILKDKLNIK